MYFTLFIRCMLSQFVYTYNPTYTLCETPFLTWQAVSAPECHRKGVNTSKIYRAADQSVNKYAVSQSAYVGWHKKSSQHVNNSTATVKVRSLLRLLEQYVINFGREITTSGCYDRNFWVVVYWLYYSISCACSTIIASSAMWIRRLKSNNKKVCPSPNFQMVLHIHHMTWTYQNHKFKLLTDFLSYNKLAGHKNDGNCFIMIYK
jgi:hypothetical protein